MIRNLQIEANQLNERLQKTFCLSPGQTQEQPQVKSRLNSDIRVAMLATAPAGFLRRPGVDRLGREPYGQTATPHQATIVGRPVGDAVKTFVIRVDLGPLCHCQIMVQEP